MFTASTAVLSNSYGVSSVSSVSSFYGPGSSCGWLQSSLSSPSRSPLSLSANGLTTASSPSLSAVSPAVSSSYSFPPQWSPLGAHAASNETSNWSGLPKFHVDRKEKTLPASPLQPHIPPLGLPVLQFPLRSRL